MLESPGLRAEVLVGTLLIMAKKRLLLNELRAKFLSASCVYDIIALHVDTISYRNCFPLFFIKG